jgi:hypothetical protein
LTTADIAKLGITGSVTASDKVYDATAVATITGRSLIGVLGGDAVIYSGGTASFSDKNAAVGKTVTATGLGLTGADSGNYAVNPTASTTANITPASLNVVANNASKTYGNALNFAGNEYTSSGLQGGETIGSVALTSAGAAPGADVAGGPYLIAASNATAGTFNPANYAIAYSSGSLIVIPAPLSVAANDASRPVAQPNPLFTASFDGFKLGQTPAALGGVLQFATSAGIASRAGAYSIVPSGLTATNYTISYVSGTLSVQNAPAPLPVPPSVPTVGLPTDFDPLKGVGNYALVAGPYYGDVNGIATVGLAYESVVPGGELDVEELNRLPSTAAGADAQSSPEEYAFAPYCSAFTPAALLRCTHLRVRERDR